MPMIDFGRAAGIYQPTAQVSKADIYTVKVRVRMSRVGPEAD
ncbi:hypothetical protein [Flavimaribacter sediminis]|nr:hypothetical protein [Flavimaribacter sediminis]